eukprot:COSAG06_NODE_28253_length_577_cov_6.759414_1_plen_33_part_01
MQTLVLRDAVGQAWQRRVCVLIPTARWVRSRCA